MFRIVSVLTPAQKQAILLFVDLSLVPLSLFFSVLLIHPQIGIGAIAALLPLAAMMMCIAALLGHLLHLTRMKLNAYEMQGLQLTAIYAIGVGLCAALMVRWLVPERFVGVVDTAVLTVFTMILLILSAGVRIAMRTFLIGLYRRNRGCKRVLIYGAGKTGLQLGRRPEK